MFCEHCGVHRDQLGDERTAPLHACLGCGRAICPNCWNLTADRCLRCAPSSIPEPPARFVLVAPVGPETDLEPEPPAWPRPTNGAHTGATASDPSRITVRRLQRPSVSAPIAGLSMVAGAGVLVVLLGVVALNAVQGFGTGRIDGLVPTGPTYLPTGTFTGGATESTTTTAVPGGTRRPPITNGSTTSPGGETTGTSRPRTGSTPRPAITPTPGSTPTPTPTATAGATPTPTPDPTPDPTPTPESTPTPTPEPTPTPTPETPTPTPTPIPEDPPPDP